MIKEKEKRKNQGIKNQGIKGSRDQEPIEREMTANFNLVKKRDMQVQEAQSLKLDEPKEAQTNTHN